MRRSRSWIHAVFLALFVAIYLPTCLAQESPGSSAGGPTASSIASDRPSQTTSAPAQTYTIQVGLADHKFKPEVTTANIGDTIEFAFYPLNHSVVRAEYGFPCIPYEMTGASKIGFFAGFHPVDTVLSSPPTYRIVVNDTEPIFFYCSAPGSCLTYGMVGAINPNATMSVQKQQQLALSSTYMLNPGEPFPAEDPSSSNPPASSATTNNGKANDEKGLSTGAIIGIVVGGSSIIFVAALLFFFWGRTTSLADEVGRKASPTRRGMHPSAKSSTAMLESSRGTNISGSGNLVHQQCYYHHPHHHPHEAPAGSHPTDGTNGGYQHYPPAPHQHRTYSPVLGYTTPPPVTSPLYFPSPSPHSYPPVAPLPPPPPPPPPPLTTTTSAEPAKHTIPRPTFFLHHQHQQFPPSAHTTPHELSPTGDSPTSKAINSSGSAGNAATAASVPTATTATAATATTTASSKPHTHQHQHQHADVIESETRPTAAVATIAGKEENKNVSASAENRSTTMTTTTTASIAATDETAAAAGTSQLVPSYFDVVYPGRG